MQSDTPRKDELDRFWTIDELLPRRQSGNLIPPQPSSTEPIELTLDPPATMRREDASVSGASPLSARSQTAPPVRGEDAPLIQRCVPPHTPVETAKRAAPIPIDTYHPGREADGNTLIHTVRIFRWPSAYNYYERFVADARRYRHAEASPCPREPFFSYVPQYAQLTEKRLNWYLYWRSQVRAGSFPDCDYTYLLLYLYEIINLGHDIEPTEGLHALCSIWQGYRQRYSRLDRFLGEWICDYCLIYHLAPPTHLFEGDADLLVSVSSFKEFWLGGIKPGEPGGQHSAYVSALLRFASNYDYHNSKFATEENLPLYDRHIRGAMTRVVEAFAGDPQHMLAGGSLQDSLLSRDAFGGALCAHENKYRIEVDYCCFTRSHELRFLVTDIIKYSENRLRAYLGIKSRLGLYALPSNIRTVIDAYIDECLPARPSTPSPRARVEQEEEKRYAPLYEPLSTSLSPDRAAEIEQASWQTTKRLIEAFGENTEPVPPLSPEQLPASALLLESAAPVSPPPVPPSPAEPVSADNSLTTKLRLLGLDAFVRAVLCNDADGIRCTAEAAGLLPDAAADRVNEAALDAFGDILLEGSGGSYQIIPDYLDEIEGI